MSQRSQVFGITLWRCSLNAFVIAIVIALILHVAFNCNIYFCSLIFETNLREWFKMNEWRRHSYNCETPGLVPLASNQLLTFSSTSPYFLLHLLLTFSSNSPHLLLNHRFLQNSIFSRTSPNFTLAQKTLIHPIYVAAAEVKSGRSCFQSWSFARFCELLILSVVVSEQVPSVNINVKTWSGKSELVTSVYLK